MREISKRRVQEAREACTQGATGSPYGTMAKYLKNEGLDPQAPYRILVSALRRRAGNPRARAMADELERQFLDYQGRVWAHHRVELDRAAHHYGDLWAPYVDSLCVGNVYDNPLYNTLPPPDRRLVYALLSPYKPPLLNCGRQGTLLDARDNSRALARLSETEELARQDAAMAEAFCRAHVRTWLGQHAAQQQLGEAHGPVAELAAKWHQEALATGGAMHHATEGEEDLSAFAGGSAREQREAHAKVAERVRHYGNRFMQRLVDYGADSAHDGYAVPAHEILRASDDKCLEWLETHGKNLGEATLDWNRAACAQRWSKRVATHTATAMRALEPCRQQLARLRLADEVRGALQSSTATAQEALEGVYRRATHDETVAARSLREGLARQGENYQKVLKAALDADRLRVLLRALDEVCSVLQTERDTNVGQRRPWQTVLDQVAEVWERAAEECVETSTYQSTVQVARASVLAQGSPERAAQLELRQRVLLGRLETVRAVQTAFATTLSQAAATLRPDAMDLHCPEVSSEALPCDRGAAKVEPAAVTRLALWLQARLGGLDETSQLYSVLHNHLRAMEDGEPQALAYYAARMPMWCKAG